MEQGLPCLDRYPKDWGPYASCNDDSQGEVVLKLTTAMFLRDNVLDMQHEATMALFQLQYSHRS